MSLRFMTFSYGTPIVCQGQPVNSLYFLISGQARVVIDPLLHRTQYPEYYPLSNEDATLQLLKETLTKYRPCKKARRRRREHLVRGYDICLIGNKNNIGDVEVIANLSTYLHSVICEQKTEAFVLDTNHYHRLISKKFPKIVHMIYSDALLKLDSRANRFKKIPLLQLILKDRLPDQHETVKTKNHDDTRLFPDPPLGPLIDIFGKGSVFYYIRMKDRRIKQGRAYKRSAWPSPNVSSHIEHNNILQQQVEVAVREQTSKPKTGIERLHLYEEQKMLEINERIQAWNIELEAVKLKYRTASSLHLGAIGL